MQGDNATVLDMISKSLKDNGFDGLVDEFGECGCETSDLAPCGNTIEYVGRCRAAYKVECDCEYNCTWHMSEVKSDAQRT